MSEANLNLEKQSPVSQNDGSEILSSAQINNGKGITRRKFLQISGAAVALWLLSGEMSKPEEEFLQPELVHNVEVYGLIEKICTERQINRLYNHLDQKLGSKEGITHLDIFINEKRYLRKELLDPNERYLEVVVRQSAYDSFLNRREETGVDFVEWIQMHVDAMNLCFENAKPPADIKSVLKRIVVISDDMPKDFYDETQKSKLGEALDWKWARRFFNRYPIDTDACWAIADDYRVDTAKEIIQGYFWSVRHQDGQTVFGWPPGAQDYEKTYKFPQKQDSIDRKQGVWLDFGLIHEWGHYLLNIPDEFRQNFHENPNATFNQFTFDTSNFLEPYLSPYLSYLIQRNIREKLRDFWGKDNRVFSYFEGNPHVRLTIEGLSENPQIKIRKNRFAGDNVCGKKSFPDEADQVGENGISLNPSIFKGYKIKPNLWSCRIITSEETYEVFIPAAAFAMSQIAGKDGAEFNIQLSSHKDPSKKTQIVKLVDQTDIDEFLQDRRNIGDKPYAKMKVDGTNTWFVWFLRD